MRSICRFSPQLVGDRFATTAIEVPTRLRLVGRHGHLMIVSGGSRGRSRTPSTRRALHAELRDVHPKEREGSMRADIRWKIESGDLWVDQVLVRRFLGPVQELLAIDDLHDAVAPVP